VNVELIREAALAQETLRRSCAQLFILAQAIEPWAPAVAEDLRDAAEQLEEVRRTRRGRPLGAHPTTP
jgi:hypothetical protein